MGVDGEKEEGEEEATEEEEKTMCYAKKTSYIEGRRLLPAVNISFSTAGWSSRGKAARGKMHITTAL
ncbi:hypothetical protein TRV_05334 [Trichophyton verrucosum HKI 0517]|uniref:Uncharacterized protein n=1 Tax=Trichophyton verrucosum (strain HKI 0517) TaxID=663202 RepID=D4DDX0_TRIVH|nr:uncharacterized protein TRV_05334 [Trichophyton verrucosum HKI 0517]EFE39947.1 hypothetical protein TRV_05334 [Trichophyton verrucosum HKI 0517]